MEYREIVKGYEFERGRYVVVTDEDLQKVRIETTRVISLTQFADVDAIDPMYVDGAYYLAPDGAVAAEAFATMRDGMAGKVGIGKVALYGREYLVAIKPQQRGLVMYMAMATATKVIACKPLTAGFIISLPHARFWIFSNNGDGTKTLGST